MLNLTIFEKILAKKIPAQIIYEDQDVLAFLDNNPQTNGHTLVIPKLKSVNFIDITPAVLATLMIKTNQIAKQVITQLGVTGYQLHINNGKSAHQEVMYTHVHIIPTATKTQRNIAPFNSIKKIADLA